jgi:putative hydrolase of the HAD superfamily
MQKVPASALTVTPEGLASALSQCSHLIFDLGRVLVPIDQQATSRAFARLGASGLEDIQGDYLKLEILHGYESGRFSTSEFLQALRVFVPGPVPEEALRDAWCAMLGRMPAAEVSLLQRLRRKHRVLMLSNTNELHMQLLQRFLSEDIPGTWLHDLFDALYLSFQMGALKPSPDIYRYLLTQERICPGQALFLDDREENVEAARAEGIPSLHFLPGMTVTELFG